MSKPTPQDHVRHLRDAERQFKLVMAVRTACTLGEQPLVVPEEWTFGSLRVHRRDLQLTEDEAKRAAAFLEHTATFTLCVAANQAIKDSVPSPREHVDPSVVAVWEIVRLIRNAYTHQPLDPVWSIDPPCRDKEYTIQDVARLATAQLDQCRVRWQDYGGLFVPLLLSRWIRLNILGDSDVVAREEMPTIDQRRIFQVGRMLLLRLAGAPSEKTVPSTEDGPIQFDMPDGQYRLAREGDQRPARVIPSWLR